MSLPRSHPPAELFVPKVAEAGCCGRTGYALAPSHSATMPVPDAATKRKLFSLR